MSFIISIFAVENFIRFNAMDFKISDICKYVVDGENGQKVYDILRESYVGKNKKLPQSQGEKGYKIEYRYEDGVLYIEEHTVGGSGGYMDEVLSFLIHYDSFYFLKERRKDGEPFFYSVGDDEGKYFIRPPKTKYEIQEEEEIREL